MKKTLFKLVLPVIFIFLSLSLPSVANAACVTMNVTLNGGGNWPANGAVGISCQGDTGSAGCVGDSDTVSPGKSATLTNCTCPQGGGPASSGCLEVTSKPAQCSEPHVGKYSNYCSTNGNTISASLVGDCPAPTASPTPAPQCDSVYGTCGCAWGCRDGAHTDFACCHRSWGTCINNQQACITVYDGTLASEPNQCGNNTSQSCGPTITNTPSPTKTPTPTSTKTPTPTPTNVQGCKKEGESCGGSNGSCCVGVSCKNNVCTKPTPTNTPQASNTPTSTPKPGTPTPTTTQKHLGCISSSGLCQYVAGPGIDGCKPLGSNCGVPTRTPTKRPSATRTPTRGPSATRTPTPRVTATRTPTPRLTSTPTSTPPVTNTPTSTSTPSVSPTPTIDVTGMCKCDYMDITPIAAGQKVTVTGYAKVEGSNVGLARVDYIEIYFGAGPENDELHTKILGYSGKLKATVVPGGNTSTKVRYQAKWTFTMPSQIDRSLVYRVWVQEPIACVPISSSAMNTTNSSTVVLAASTTKPMSIFDQILSALGFGGAKSQTERTVVQDAVVSPTPEGTGAHDTLQLLPYYPGKIIQSACSTIRFQFKI